MKKRWGKSRQMSKYNTFPSNELAIFFKERKKHEEEKKTLYLC